MTVEVVHPKARVLSWSWYGGENFTVGVTTTSEGGITGVFQHDVRIRNAN